VKEFWKSVSIWQSYRQKYSVLLFWLRMHVQQLAVLLFWKQTWSYFFSRCLCWRKLLLQQKFQVHQQTVTRVPVYTHYYKLFQLTGPLINLLEYDKFLVIVELTHSHEPSLHAIKLEVPLIALAIFFPMTMNHALWSSPSNLTHSVTSTYPGCLQLWKTWKYLGFVNSRKLRWWREMLV